MTTATANPAEALIEQHRPTLERALEAIRTREYFSQFPEQIKAQPEGALEAGQRAFDGYLGTTFPIEVPGADSTVNTERSPFGLPLDISYPHADADALIHAAQQAMPAWRNAGPETRAAVAIEILTRLYARSVEIAFACMHTSGQAFGMAFQAGGPHAQDRGLEAVAYAYAEMTRHAAEARWEKPQGKRGPLVMTKRFNVVPRGVALVIGCNTFPTWNSYPGLFASLTTGNAVLVKPHPRAVLPLAISVAIAREVLAEAGFDPNLVTLAAEQPDEKLAATLAQRPEVKIIDFTGSTAFGDWLETNAPQAQVYTEKAGVNTIVIDSTDDYPGMLNNVAFSLSLYTGQMCTAPQNLLIPRDGISVGGERKSFSDVTRDLAGAVDALLGEEKRAVEILGAVVNDDVVGRIERAGTLGEVVLASRAVDHPAFPSATVRTPTIIGVDASDEQAFGEECFGPVAFAVATDSTDASIDVFRKVVGAKGALTVSVYSTDEGVLDAMEDAAQDVGVALSCNLTGGVYVNQSAAFSDFHGTGANAAANAALTDGAYVAGRFRVVQSRRHA
jgi:phenylacetic acid degradation protein paaN